MLSRKYLAALIAVFLAAAACTRQQPAPAPAATTPATLERPVSLAGTSQAVLAETFTLKSEATFPFEIPAHATQPHLHGIFESHTGDAHGPSDDRANIDFMVLNQQQQDALAGNRAAEAMFTVEASHNQAVNLDLPPSMGQPVKYYLVFHNLDGATTSRSVNANFRVDF
jgi:hypothetical protein